MRSSNSTSSGLVARCSLRHRLLIVHLRLISSRCHRNTVSGLNKSSTSSNLAFAPRAGCVSLAARTAKVSLSQREMGSGSRRYRLVAKLMRHRRCYDNPCSIRLQYANRRLAAYFESFAGGYTNLPSRSSHLRRPNTHEHCAGGEQSIRGAHVHLTLSFIRSRPTAFPD
jgi:hypothetical protein